MEKAYAQALSATVSRGTSEEELSGKLLTHLAEEGRMKLLPKILRELHVQKARAKTLGTTLEIASEKEKEEAIRATAALGITAEQVSVNPSLIRGWRSRSGSMLVDHSAKRALTDLYRRITS